ncbi:NapC/NirT family cytochrome c [Pseudomonadota bacterium]
MFGKIWRWFARPSKLGWGMIFVGGGVAGVIFWGGFNTYMEHTNSLEFCISCHEMRDNVYQEYKQTVHYSNASGVRAVCSDCHVPKEWVPKFIRKIKASNELFHKIMGTVDTPEKFEAHRLTMAERVWATMEANDSQECRNCHSYDTMKFDAQRHDSAEMMQMAKEEGMTCIDCHKGIAHKLPEGME